MIPAKDIRIIHVFSSRRTIHRLMLVTSAILVNGWFSSRSDCSTPSVRKQYQHGYATIPGKNMLTPHGEGISSARRSCEYVCSSHPTPGFTLHAPKECRGDEGGVVPILGIRKPQELYLPLSSLKLFCGCRRALLRWSCASLEFPR